MLKEKNTQFYKISLNFCKLFLQKYQQTNVNKRIYEQFKYRHFN